MQGNLVLAYFLKQWGPAWARKHIHHVVAASGPWAGAVKAIKGTVSGENFGLPIPHNLLHSLQGVAPSGPWLFPAPDVWPADDVIVRTNVRHYTAADLGALLQVLSPPLPHSYLLFSTPSVFISSLSLGTYACNPHHMYRACCRNMMWCSTEGMCVCVCE